MTHFQHIHVEGFRRLYDLPLELRPLTVMIGANGGGKTSLLDVFSLLAASASGGLSDKISEFSGIGALTTLDRSPAIRFKLSMAVSQAEPLIYDLTIASSGATYQIADETLSQQRRPQPPPFKHIDSHGSDIRYFEVDDHNIVRPTWDHNPLESSLAQVPKMYKEPEELRTQLASSTYYGSSEKNLTHNSESIVLEEVWGVWPWIATFAV